MIAQKPWGTTERLSLGDVQIERVSGKAGCASSLHRHQHKHNAFLVLRGTMQIELPHGLLENAIDPDDPPDAFFRTLTAGDYHRVPAGVLHRMIFQSDCEALEIYWRGDGEEVDPDDIVRLMAGWVA